LKKSENLYNPHQRPRVIVAPLDWGLGHTTRCIPIIRELIFLNCEVFIVADKASFLLLKKEFPFVQFLQFKGYEITYSQRKRFFSLKLFLQMPAIFSKIFTEKRWLAQIIEQYSIDAVISDNRFGMYSNKIPSVYITHQLFIKTGSHFSEKIAQKIHYYFIQKYSACWVPDQENDGLAGKLSHPQILPAKARYIGPLSRFKPTTDTDNVYDLLIILSGPEPQRTIFEDLLFSQIENLKGKIMFVRGLPTATEKPANFNRVTIENHIPSDELNQLLAESRLVVCRSGYTSVMDLSVLQKKAILVPTPGQTEQKYLAEYLLEQQYFYSESQKNFSIVHAMKKADAFPFKKPCLQMDEYRKTLAELVAYLRAKMPK
jgi:uncharacterized protein (TIGR00661 family)